MVPSHSNFSKCCVLLLHHLFHKTFIVLCHPAANNEAPLPALLDFHPNSNPSPPPDYFATSVISCTLLEWNSSVAIPLDTWNTVITAMVYCAGCNHICSFDRDCLHCDAGGTALCSGHHLGIREVNQPVINKIKKVLIQLNKLIALMHLIKCFKCKLSKIKAQIKGKILVTSRVFQWIWLILYLFALIQQ